MYIPFQPQPSPSETFRPDATEVMIVALHAAALVVFFVNPTAGAILLAGSVTLALGLSRPLPVAVFTLAILWVNVVMADFYPEKQYTAWKDVLLLFMSAGWALRCVILRRPIAIRHPITVPLLLIILYYVVMCAMTPDVRQAALGLKATVFYAAWYFLLPEMVQTKDDARLLLGAVLFGTICLGAYDLWRVSMPYGFFPPTRAGKVLPGALLAHFSGTAIFLAPGVILGAALLPSARKWGRVLAITAIALGFAGITAELARSVWATMALSFVAMVALSRRAQLVGAVVFALVAAGVIASLFPLKVADRAASAFDSGDVSRKARGAEFSTVTLPFMLKHPLGAGTGTMSSAGSITVWGGGDRSDLLLLSGFIHNGFLMVAIEIGWLGLAIYVWFLAAALSSAWRTFASARDPFVRDAALGLFGIMVFFVAQHFSGPMLTVALFGFDMWVFLGLLAILPRLDTPIPDATGAAAA